MNSKDILKCLMEKSYLNYHNINIPEFTYSDLRIDLIKIDLRHRWIRGYEIKVNKGDFNRDDKWTLYSKFLSSLTIVCPAGFIQKEEIRKPIGLIWIEEREKIEYVDWTYEKYSKKILIPKIVLKPKNFQTRKSLAWLWTYVSVLEVEFPRIIIELNKYKNKEILGIV